MRNIMVRLDEWRDAERRRDALPAGSSEWQAADEEVRRARTAYHAAGAQASAYHAELDLAELPAWRAWLPVLSERWSRETGASPEIASGEEPS